MSLGQDSVIETVALSLFLTDTRLRRALLGCCPAADAADQRRYPGLDRLAARFGDTPGDLRADAREMRERADCLLTVASRLGISVVCWWDRRYPARLASLEDPPAVLWLRGDSASLGRPTVAVVGSRAGSTHALQVAERLGSGLCERGVTVVSGLARGVDTAAHRGALAGGGPTVAVLGSGVDVVYPPEHGALAGSIADHGAVVSELGPGAPPLRHHFPWRNRLISGLSHGVVVVEAAARSGSLITARCALDQGRDVMAVPGNVLSGRSAGAHALIRDGAKIVETVDDILEEIGVGPAGDAAERNRDDEADPVVRQMDLGEICDLDGLSERSGVDPMSLLARLTDLELEGRVARVGTGRFVRLRR